MKKETVMEGWTRKGEVLKCVSCGAVIEELKEEKTEKKVSPLENDAALKFKSLLGEEFGKKPEIKAAADEKKFCRDCAHLIAHPFLTRCMKFARDVNPMDDCPSFTPKKEE
ncbi:MAG: hypothetical protein ACI4UV_00860 [Victivallales bacterium]